MLSNWVSGRLQLAARNFLNGGIVLLRCISASGR
jgi:hypothetical protein